MRAHRGVNAAGDQRVLEHLAVHAFTHAVQALQLKSRTCPERHRPAQRWSVGATCRYLQDGCDGGRVVRGELRVDGIRRGQQRAGAGEVRHVGVVLVGEHGVGGQAQLLCALDLGVPVRALDQAAHQAQLVFSRNVGDVCY